MEKVFQSTSQLTAFATNDFIEDLPAERLYNLSANLHFVKAEPGAGTNRNSS